MKLTERFCMKMRYFRSKALEIERRYQAEMEKIERFRGSEGYNDHAAQLSTTRNAELSALRTTVSSELIDLQKEFNSALDARRDPLPTPEQAAALQTLKLLEKPSPRADCIARKGNGGLPACYERTG